MKRTLLVATGLAIMSTAGTILPLGNSAEAATCVPCTQIQQIVDQRNSQAERDIKKHVDNRIDDLIEHLTKVTQHLSGELMKQTTAESEMRDAEQSMVTRRLQQEKENEARQQIIESNAGSCVTVTGQSAVMSSGKKTAQYKREMSEAEDRRQRNNTEDTAGSATKSNFAVLKRKYGKYCSEADAAKGLCSAVEERMQDAHVKASTLMDERQAGTLDQEMLEAAQDLCAFSTRATPPSALTKDQVVSPVGGPAQVARDEFDARISWANSACFELISSQSPSMDLKAWAEAATGDAEYINQYAEGISVYDFMRIEVERRVDPNWYVTNLSGTNDSTKLRAMAEMMAINMYIDWQTHKLLRNINMTNAITAAAVSQQSYETQMAKVIATQ